MSDERRIPGRATSQVSIYDYPEHLNPFYEDENHKRLRFWKINSSSKVQNQKTGRSNSFSFSGLKDIWAFKSFKLKKKSSTLGVNKTSESPPELRRVYPLDDTYNTVDSKSRHTFDIGHGNNFQRSAGYRSSLQNVHSTGGDSNGFYRNDRYRSTIQNGSQTLATTSPQRDRYVCSGSVTPTPRTRYVTPQSRYGSSQTSINSTNPFDEDDNISRCESVDGVSLRKRKKRKAPQPPVTCPAISTNQQTCTTVEENTAFDVTGKEDIGEISNLTAEIETFVRTHDNDQEIHEKSPQKKKDKSPPIPPTRTTSHTTTVIKEKNETSSVDVVENSQNTVSVVTVEKVPIQTVVSVHDHSVEEEQQVQTKVSDDNIIPLNESLQGGNEHRKLNDRKKLASSRESPENNEDYPERTSQTPDIENTITIRKANSEKQLNVHNNVEVERHVETVIQSPPRIIIRKPTEDWECDEEIRLNDDVNGIHQVVINVEESPKTPISSEVEFILEHDRSSNASPNTQKINPEVVLVETMLSEASSLVKNESNKKPNASSNTQKLDPEVVVVETVLSEASSSNEKPKVSTKKNFENSLENFSEVPRENHETVEKSPLENVPELKIVESTEDLTSSPAISQSSERYKIRFVALKSLSPETQRRDVELRSHNSQEFDVEDIDLPPAPPQRRRSVKDIIASINKSQSLLKVNQHVNGNTDTKRNYNYDTYLPQTIPTTIKEPSQSQSKASNESIIRKFNELHESESKLRKMINEMEKSSMNVPVPVVEKFDEFPIDNTNSNDLFKKCVVRREKNVQSGASQDESRSSMDWNPLPKPRRSRNLSHEIENGNI